MFCWVYKIFTHHLLNSHDFTCHFNFFHYFLTLTKSYFPNPTNFFLSHRHDYSSLCSASIFFIFLNLSLLCLYGSFFPTSQLFHSRSTSSMLFHPKSASSNFPYLRLSLSWPEPWRLRRSLRKLSMKSEEIGKDFSATRVPIR